MINEDSFVLINFVGRVVSTNKVFDLTRKDVAEKEGIEGDYNFSPILVIPKAGYVLKAVSDSLIGKNTGDKYSLKVSAKDGFGIFDQHLIKTYGMAVFRDNQINPSVGDTLLLDNKVATVLSVNSGRVMVSFNHPLAGKDLDYEIEIVTVLESDKEKCESVFQHYVGKKPDELNIENNKVAMATKEDVKGYILDSIKSDITKYVNKDFSIEIKAKQA